MMIGIDSSAQEGIESSYQRKNSFFFQWGYNRANYQDTDIHFKGEGFDFTIRNVSAHDEPTPFSSDIYLNPLKMTIPQFNFRVGWFINERTSISLGWDHMKYVMESYQRIRIEGDVSEDFSEEFAGSYFNQKFDTSPSFLKFEHTDGLNYVRLGIERHTPVWNNQNKTLSVDAIIGASMGPVFTWTDATINGRRYENWLHCAGAGVSGQLALQVRFKNSLFIQYQHQSGYIQLGDIIFMEDESRASQEIVFSEQSIVIGAQLPIFIGKNPN
ncbi:MAG: hypothetical protein HKN45_02965 [Flavobacteriales bacterium]|nr:hypothetical protein [Flavobacteriales bacterium]